MSAPAAPQRTEFSLRALAREVWAELEGADYHDFAKELQRRIRAKDRDAALAQALTEWSRRFAADQRPTSADIERMIRPIPAGGATQSPANDIPAPARKTADINSARSPKVRMIREAYLMARYRTADGQKALRDCTRADVIFIADGLDVKAKQNAAKAALMRKLASALVAHGADCIRELPENVLAEVLTRSAA
jgi:hypothetical protein